MPKTSKVVSTRIAKREALFGRRTYYLIINKDLKQALKDAQERFVSLTDITFPDSWEGLSLQTTEGEFVVVPEAKMDWTMIHELQHINYNVLSLLDIPHVEDTDEVYSYHLDMLYSIYEDMIDELSD